MSRTLHVIDQPGETPEAAVLRLSLDAARLDHQNKTDQHAWLLFGGEATGDAARSIGMRQEQYRLLPRPAGLHRMLPAAMARPKQLMQQAHRVTCWTEGATQIASMLGCAHVSRRVHDATLSPFAKRIIDCQHNEPAASDQPDRQARRQRWGVNEDTAVVALLGDRFDQIDSSAAALATVFTHEALRATSPDRADVRLLCHPLAKRRAEATQLTELLTFDRLLIQDAAVATPWSVLPGCDVALALRPAQAGLSILWANAMSVPVITPHDHRQPMLAELDHVIPARSGAPKDLADTLTKWVQSRACVPTG